MKKPSEKPICNMILLIVVSTSQRVLQADSGQRGGGRGREADNQMPSVWHRSDNRMANRYVVVIVH